MFLWEDHYSLHLAMGPWNHGIMGPWEQHSEHDKGRSWRRRDEDEDKDEDGDEKEEEEDEDEVGWPKVNKDVLYKK